MSNPKDCSCDSNETHFHLYQEIESLKRRVGEQDAHIVTLETALIRQEPSNQSVQQDRYERLQESHKKLQRVNQALEDKLLRVVDRFESERTALKDEVNNLSIRLADALEQNSDLKKERDRYKNDCLVAVQLLNDGTVDHVLRSLKPSSSPTPAPVRQQEKKTIVTTTFPPTSILVDRSTFYERKTSVNEDTEQESNGLKPPSEFLMHELSQKVKSTEYSINFRNLQDSIEL